MEATAADAVLPPPETAAAAAAALAAVTAALGAPPAAEPAAAVAVVRNNNNASAASNACSDPFEMLSAVTKQFLVTSMGISTAEQFLSTRTTEIAAAFVQFRIQQGMPELKGSGPVASVSGWKASCRKHCKSMGMDALAEVEPIAAAAAENKASPLSPAQRKAKAATKAAAQAAAKTTAPPPPPNHPYPPYAAAAAPSFSSVIYSLRNCFMALNDTQFESEVEIERTRRRFYATSSGAGAKKAPPPAAAAATGTDTATTAGDSNKKRAAAASTTEMINAENEDSSNTNSKNKKHKTSQAAAAAANTSATTVQGGGDGPAPPAWSYANMYPPPPYYYHHPPPYAAADADTTAATTTIIHRDPHHHYAYPPPPPPLTAAEKRKRKKKQQVVVAQSAAAQAQAAIPPGPPVQRANVKKFWNEQYEQLCIFRQEFGHTIIPNKNKKYASLHNWLRKTKEKWRKQVVTKEPLTCPLSNEQIQKLVAVGAGTLQDGPTNFAESAISNDWNLRFAELVAFKNQNGHTDVSDFKHKDTHYRLAVWVINQRKNFQNRQSMATTGKKKFAKNGVMTEEQMLKFASIGFRFSHVLTNIDERIVQLQEFKSIHGHTQVPIDYSGHSGLGLWCRKTRDQYHLNKLTASRIEKLDAIDFDWNRGSSKSPY